MDNINDIYKFINFLADKYRNGYLSPEEVSLALSQSQNQVFLNYLGKRQNGNELALVALKPFYKTANITASSGFVAYPSLWAETQGVYVISQSGTTSVRVVLHNELAEALKSVIYPIATNPRYLEQSGGFQLYPSTISSVSVHYLARPIPAVMGYSVSGTDIVYDPLTSVQLEFDKQYWNEIIELACLSIGINLSDPEVASYAQGFQLNANNGNDGN